MKIRKCLTIALVCLGLTASAQQMDSLLYVYANQFPKERIHVHFDRSSYNREETIWYKAYVLDDQGLTQLSKNLYVEWYDESGKLLANSASPLFQSTAKGSFEIPAEFNGNVLRVKVFTRWSLNDDPAFLYEKDISINQNNPIKKEVPMVKTRVDVFPEGGELLLGISSRVAFKATDNYGIPVKIKAILYNDKNKALDTLKVKHDGMGSFFIKPNPGEAYIIKWTDPMGKSGTTGLPVAKKEGVSLSVRTTNEFAIVKVERTATVPEQMKMMNLVVHMNQALLYKVSLNATDRNILSANLPISELNTGVVQFTLFAADGVPIAERIAFVNNRYHEFGAKLIPQLTTLTRRGKNVFDVYVSDTTVTNMSVAVTDASLESPLSERTILSDLLLSNEIRGRVYKPGYYLSSDSDSVMANLDLVMLTHGWRKIDWARIKEGKGPELKYPIETEQMKITGKVYGLKNISVKDPVINLILQNKDSSKNFFFEPVTKEGLFETKELYVFDTARLFYSFNGNQKLDALTQIQFENGLVKPASKQLSLADSLKPIIWNDSLARASMNRFLLLQEEWKKKSAYKTLQEVIIKSRAKPKEEAIDQRYSSGLFAGGNGQVFDIMSDPAANAGFDILTYLQGRVAGLQISRGGGAGGGVSMSWRGAMPDLYLDQMRVDAGTIQSINIRDIAMVKVFNPPFFGSVGGGSGGAIAIYTKKGGDYNKGTGGGASNKGMLTTIIPGYTRFKEFYNPQYDNPSENPETDIRATLYWNPYVMTNKKSPRYRIQFFNNDVSKRLLITLEGVNADGKLTRQVAILE